VLSVRNLLRFNDSEWQPPADRLSGDPL